jgi:integrase
MSRDASGCWLDTREMPIYFARRPCFNRGMAVRYALNKNKYLIDPEVEHLERTLASSAVTDQRDALMLELGLRTGARASELLGLRHVDLNIYDATVFIRGIKGSNDRELPLPKQLFERLLTYSQLADREKELFPIGYHRLRQIWDWYRPAPKKFHSLRHTFAIRLYRKTKDIRLVQVALGHRNITNTMVYADYVYSQQELKKLIL